MLFDAPLRFHRGSDRGGRVGEHGHERVSFGVVDASAVSDDRVANDAMVVAHDLHPSILSQAPG
jgi:hypothetical protein